MRATPAHTHRSLSAANRLPIALLRRGVLTNEQKGAAITERRSSDPSLHSSRPHLVEKARICLLPLPPRDTAHGRPKNVQARALTREMSEKQEVKSLPASAANSPRNASSAALGK